MREKLDKLRQAVLGRPWAVALLLLPFFKPMGLTIPYESVDRVFMYWKIAEAPLIALLFLSRPKVSAVTALLGVYEALALLATRLYGQPMFYPLYKVGNVALLCALLEAAVGTDPRALVKGLFYALGGLWTVNVLTAVFDLKLDERYFMGHENFFALFVLPLFGIMGLYTSAVHWPFWLRAALTVFFSLPVYIAWPASCVVAASAFLALFFVQRLRKSYLVCNIGTYYVVIAVMFVLLVVLRQSDRFAFLLKDMLHKDVTLSGRLKVWDKSLACIAARPLLGYGILVDAAATELVGNVHCHDIFLQCLFEAGVPGLIVYLALLAVLARQLWQVRTSEPGFLLAASLFALLVNFTVEVPTHDLPYTCILLLCGYARTVVPALVPPDGTAQA